MGSILWSVPEKAGDGRSLNEQYQGAGQTADQDPVQINAPEETGETMTKLTVA